MMRSLYSGISGLRNHQTRMDVIGNNIANVNTAGYKTSRVIFQDIFSQNVSAGMGNQGQIGGTNPTQIGLGIRLSTIDVIHSKSAFQRTDRETDMAINGDGFFIVAQLDDNGFPEPFYTRAGNFDIDNEGYLVTSQGLYVMGYNRELVMGIADPGSPAIPFPGQARILADEDIIANETFIPAGYFREGEAIPPGMFGPNTPATAPFGGFPDRIMQSLITVPAPRNVPALAEQSARPPVPGLVDGGPAPGADPNGLTRIRLKAMANVIPRWEDLSPAQQDALTAANAFGADPALLEDFLGQFPVEEVSLPGFAVADNGDVSVILGNRKLVIGRIALAMFANPPGLEKAGNSLYRETASSGPVVVTEAYLDGAGKIDGGGLEMSNVDLASEFTDMIVTQRGFQANSRIITVSDTMLEELVNLKR